MIKAKPKKCKICKSEFMPSNSMIKHCSPECGYKIHTANQDKKHKKEKIAFRLDDKKISQWIAEAQVSVNTYVRLRDAGKPCICCGRVYPDDSGEWDAGHYRSRGASPNLRFNLHNIHRQAKHCNRYLGGNYSEYRIGLVERIGIDKVEAIEVNNGYKKFDRHYCERVKRIFNKKSRIQKKRLGLD
jgi:hypothetical protein